MAASHRGYAHRIDIEAPAERVWRALTDAAAVGRWCAPGAIVRAKAGGRFAASVDRIDTLEALIDVWDPPRRLRLIHMPRPGLPSGDVALVDDFLLDASTGPTIVRLLGSGFPEDRSWDAYYLRLRTGWERALARLKVFLEKRLDEVPA
jgi:uncharacterized protein YndB with AHSA1/START domain